MATYVIGDIQGCFAELMALLEKINFNPKQDRLGFTGDLVNRGPDSLATLRFIKSLQDPIVVLGNHDLYMLGLATKAIAYSGQHTLLEVFEAPDKLELLDWLRQQPLLIHNTEHNFVMSHAGIPPCWNLSQALSLAREVEDVLKADDYITFLRNMEGDLPARWEDNLEGWDRLRYIVNAFTRMRFCKPDGTLELNNKSAISHDPQVWHPWFEFYKLEATMLFGHWASLEGQCSHPKCEALDTACLWGKTLTAYCVEDGQRFSVPAIT